MERDSMGNRLTVMVVFASVALLGCSASELEKLSDTDLRTKLNECDYQEKVHSVSNAQVCHNYRRECARRLEEEGRFVCK